MITQKLQSLLDEKVAGSPRARDLLAQLEGRRMRIIARFTPWDVTLLAKDGKLCVLPGEPALVEGGPWPPPDVTLAGSPLALLSLQTEDPAVVIRRGDVTLSGDGETGARFQELVALLKPDVTEGLSRLIGDVPAQGVADFARKAIDWGRSSVTTQATNLGEFLAHETRVLVPRAEARQFIDDVDALREQVDRVAARVAALEARGQAS